MTLHDPFVLLTADVPDRASMLDRLQRSGCLCLRGAVHRLAQFEAVTGRWIRQFHQPATRVNTRERSDDGFTSQVAKTGRLLAHAEAYYRPCVPPPDICVFWCEVAPTVAGGETSWFDGAEFHDALPAAVAQRLEAEGIVYEALWPMTRWQAEFGVLSIPNLRCLLDADQRCVYTLTSDGDLHLKFKVNPIVVAADGSKRFVNGMLAHLPEIKHPRYLGVPVYCRPSNRVHWGGGGEIHADVINRILDAHDKVLRKHRWVSGDLLVLDNHRVLHGRELMAEGGDRVIFSRFGYV